MPDNELLHAISDMLDTKLKPVNDRLDKIEATQENCILPRLEKLEESVEKLEQSVKKLEQSQRETEQKVEKLEESVKKLEQSQRKTEQTVGKLEQSVKKLEQSQRKTEQTVGKLEQSVERLDKSVENLEQSVKKIELTLENNVLPRLQTIESCYTSTYERYQNGVDKIESMQTDIEVIKKTVIKHSERIQKLA